MNISFMMTVATLILVFIWSFERGTKQLMQLETVKIQSTDMKEKIKNWFFGPVFHTKWQLAHL